MSVDWWHDRRLMLPDRMQDDGLVVRRWVAGDAEALNGVMAESASHLRPWLTWVEQEDTSIGRRRVSIAERERRAGAWVLLGMFVGERIAGGCSFTVGTPAAGVVEIGYWLHPHSAVTASRRGQRGY
jgi:ribosomal-protein-serine acetyltransferase